MFVYLYVVVVLFGSDFFILLMKILNRVGDICLLFVFFDCVFFVIFFDKLNLVFFKGSEYLMIGIFEYDKFLVFLLILIYFLC